MQDEKNMSAMESGRPENVVQIEAAIRQEFAAAPDNLMANVRLALPEKPASLNGITHGLSGQNILLSAEEIGTYFRLGRKFLRELMPVGVREMTLAQRIFDANWRLNRVSAIENNLLNAELFGLMRSGSADRECRDQRSAEVVAHARTFRDGSDCFERLGRYETRLARNCAKWTEELDTMQARRERRQPDVVFEPIKCSALHWYDRMLNWVQNLQAAKAELAAQAESRAKRQAKPEGVTGAKDAAGRSADESKASGEISVGKKSRPTVAAMREALLLADRAGLLTPEEAQQLRAFPAAA